MKSFWKKLTDVFNGPGVIRLAIAMLWLCIFIIGIDKGIGVILVFPALFISIRLEAIYNQLNDIQRADKGDSKTEAEAKN